jgi:hypothetical protein
VVKAQFLLTGRSHQTSQRFVSCSDSCSSSSDSSSTGLPGSRQRPSITRPPLLHLLRMQEILPFLLGWPPRDAGGLRDLPHMSRSVRPPNESASRPLYQVTESHLQLPESTKLWRVDTYCCRAASWQMHRSMSKQPGTNIVTYSCLMNKNIPNLHVQSKISRTRGL